MSQDQITVPKDSRKAHRRVSVEDWPVLPPLLAGAIRLLHGSCRFHILGQEHEREALSAGRSILYACWHFAFPAVIYHFRDRNGMLMVSRSRDGEWISRVLPHLGYKAARGSPGKGGGTALRQMISHVRAGHPGGLIADGSQGPAQVAQKGILILARQTLAPLVPVSMAARPCWRLSTWDRTMFPRPLSKVAISFGPPLWLDREASDERVEEIRVELESCLNRLTREAEAALGPRA